MRRQRSKDGQIVALADGYVSIYIGEKRVLYHRWVYEQYHKCCLLPWIHVHHIDGNTHNNFPNNLEALSSAEHMRRHTLGQKRIPENRNCLFCKTHASTGWFVLAHGFLCKNCDQRLRRKRLCSLIPHSDDRLLFRRKIMQLRNQFYLSLMNKIYGDATFPIEFMPT